MHNIRFGTCTILVTLALAACAAPADDTDVEEATGAQTMETCETAGASESPERPEQLDSISDEIVGGTFDLSTSDMRFLTGKRTQWFRVHAKDAGSNPFAPFKPSFWETSCEGGVRVCAFVKRSVTCEHGTPSTFQDMKGCCDTRYVKLDLETPIKDDTTDILVRTTLVTPSDKCVPYFLSGAASYQGDPCSAGE